jgi:hypothetical protein
MSPALFCAIGEALYGTQWQGDLAIALDIDKRNIRRWAAGGREVPDQYRERILILVADRLALLQDLARQI